MSQKFLNNRESSWGIIALIYVINTEAVCLITHFYYVFLGIIHLLTSLSFQIIFVKEIFI